MRSFPFLLVAAAGLGAVSCADPAVRGEILLSVQSDMSIPKDVDKLYVEVLSNGVRRHALDYAVGPHPATNVPATLGILANIDDPSAPAQIRIAARQNGTIRFLREVVTTAPDARVALLRVPIEWLCVDDFATEEAEGDFNDKTLKSSCPDGETCIAGQCASSEVDSATLPDYQAEDVYGGGAGPGEGACFDTSYCFAGAGDANVDLDDCTVTVADDGLPVNVAIRTDVSGICGPQGCFVLLDGDGSSAFKMPSGGVIQLPPGVCDRIVAKKAIGVVVSTKCETKTQSLPPCGAWSSAGQVAEPETPLPLMLAGGQSHPAGLAVDGDTVYWTNAGEFGKKDGSVRKMPAAGGTLEVLVSGEDRPKGIATFGGSLYWSSSGEGFVKTLPKNQKTPSNVATMMNVPDGIAANADNVFWTTFGDGKVWSAPRQGGAPTALATGQNYPVRIVVGPNAVAYWTNEGTFGATDGSVANKDGSLVAEQSTPVGIAADDVAVYWTNFAEVGSVNRITLSDGMVTVLATEQNFPSAVAVDGKNVYWTNRGDGRIMSAPKVGGGTPVVVATGQQSPVAITVTDTGIYWLTEGTSSAANGTVMTRVK